MDDERFRKVFDKADNSIPDGLMDASSYVDKIEGITNLLSNYQDHEDDFSRIAFMMNMYEFCAKDYEALVALTYVLSLIVGSLDNLVEGSFETLVLSLKEDIMPTLRENQSSVPYWND